MDDITDLIEIPTRGGYREGSGRKPGYSPKQANTPDGNGDTQTNVTLAFSKARARKETALADMHELEFKIKSGKYLPREAFRDACATLLSSVAQSLRALPDNLERKHNLNPVQAGEVERTINAALADLAQDLEDLTSEQ